MGLGGKWVEMGFEIESEGMTSGREGNEMNELVK